MTTLVSRVTAPFCVSKRPSTDAPFWAVIDTSVKKFPAISPLVPMVVDEPTCQNTFVPLAPFARMIRLPGAEVKLDPIWKTQIALESPPASRVRSPTVISSDELET